MSRYQRQLNLPGFGPVGQRKLAEASVLVIGAGGLGIPVLQYLCAMGLGRIGIVDGDRVQLSNLHRQVLYDMTDIGMPKAEAAAAKLRAMNPDVQIDVYQQMLQPGNAIAILSGYELAVDATDVFSARYLINDACVMLGKPWVFGAVHQYDGQLSVFNYQGGPTYRCLFPKQPGAQEIPDCATGGVLGVVPGIVGSRQALEVVKLITGIGNPLSGVVLMMDLLRDSEYRMRLKPVPENLQITALQETYETACDTVPGIDPQALHRFLRDHDPVLWDLREAAAFELQHLAFASSTPMALLAQHAAALDPQRPLVVYCQRGNRSRLAVEQLRALRPELQVFSLNGGIDACPQDLYAL